MYRRKLVSRIVGGGAAAALALGAMACDVEGGGEGELDPGMEDDGGLEGDAEGDADF